MKKEINLEHLGIIPERPPSLDQKGNRKKIHPAKVRGKFKQARTLMQAFLIFIFLILPWIPYKGEQSILFDIANRKFVFFGHTFYSHDSPLLFFLISIGVFSIFLMTAVWGRVWCGWACPQTVFIDSIFRRIEEWIEGTYIYRRKLDQEPWTSKKILKKIIKWTVFFLMSSHIAHSFTAYFVGAKELVWVTTHSPFENLDLFVFVQFFTAITLFNFGWFREQFCLIVCPYGRFQSVLMDENSKAILYDPNRGEPRKTRGLKDHGDCVNCFRCVNVCPTGIDIRNGLQLECIACTACADACDEIMDKVGYPKGLIKYTSESELKGEKKSSFTTRSWIYLCILIVLILSFSTILLNRKPLEIKIVRAIESPYSVVTSNDKTIVINHFRLHLTNQTAHDIQLDKFELKDFEELENISPELSIPLKPNESKWVHLFIKFSLEKVPTGKKGVHWEISYHNSQSTMENITGEMTLLGPNTQKKKTHSKD